MTFRGNDVDKLTPAQIDVLLDKLISDDGYRALLLSDPAAALEEIGAPTTLALCFSKCTQLADASTLLRSRATIQRQLLSTGSMIVHALVVSEEPRTVRFSASQSGGVTASL